MDQFCFEDREGYAYSLASRGYGGEEFLKAAYVAPIRRGGHRDREVVNLGDHKAHRYTHVEGGDGEKKEEGGRWGTLERCRRRPGSRGWGSLGIPGYSFFPIGKKIPIRPYRRELGRPGVRL